MQKYKVIQGSTIIAVVEGLEYVKQKSNGLILPCSQANAMGITNEDGSKVWHLEGLQEFKQGDYATVKIAEITEDEYIELKAALGIDETIEEPEVVEQPDTEVPEVPEDDDTAVDVVEDNPDTDTAEDEPTGVETIKRPTEEVMSPAVMRQKILELEQKVATLEAEKEALVAYHETVSDASVNSIAKMRTASSQTVTDITAIKDATENPDSQEAANEEV